MDEALKPCPAECLHTVDRGGPSLFRRRGDIFGVYCQTCQCSTEYYSTEAEAITAWNTRADAAPTPKADEVEAVARAICATRGLSPDALYQHHEWEPWPIDRRDEYVGLGGEVRINLMHYAWRRHTESAEAVIAALDAARGDPVARVVEWLRSMNARHAEFLADRIERGEPFNG